MEGEGPWLRIKDIRLHRPGLLLFRSKYSGSLLSQSVHSRVVGKNQLRCEEDIPIDAAGVLESNNWELREPKSERVVHIVFRFANNKFQVLSGHQS